MANLFKRKEGNSNSIERILKQVNNKLPNILINKLKLINKLNLNNLNKTHNIKKTQMNFPIKISRL